MKIKKLRSIRVESFTDEEDKIYIRLGKSKINWFMWFVMVRQALQQTDIHTEKKLEKLYQEYLINKIRRISNIK